MSPYPTGDNGRLPFAPRQRERFIVTFYYDGVSVQQENLQPGGTWLRISEMAYSPRQFYMLLANWFKRQPTPKEGRETW